MTSSRYCTSCGTQISSDASFCSECGQQVEVGVGEKKKGLSKGAKKTVGVIVLLALVIWGISAIEWSSEDSGGFGTGLDSCERRVSRLNHQAGVVNAITDPFDRAVAEAEYRIDYVGVNAACGPLEES